MIIRPDEHMASYVYQKQVDPDTKIVLRQFERRVVDQVDKIIELAHGQRDYITSQNDWLVVEEIMKFWAKEWPNEWIEFKQSIPDIRSSRNEGGYSDSKEIKYVGAIPPRLMKLIKAIFPAQEWNKNFINKFVNKYKVFKVGESLDPKYRR